METLSEIALSLTPGLGPAGVRHLLRLFDGEDPFALPPATLRQAFSSPSSPVLRAIIDKAAFGRAEQELRYIEQHGIRTLFCTHPDYPQRLNRAETSDCPVLLYVLGGASLNPERSVALVGTRRATPQGRDTTADIVSQLLPLGTTIVSGLAYGIDTAAHSAALQHNLPTLAILGHGLDRIYPPQNRALAASIVNQGGALVTEYPAGTPINPNYFPARNRIIAALSDATVVVEASDKGGALITAAISTTYQRDVFACPGRLSDPYSRGTNNLIATDRATLLRNADDIASRLGWPRLQSAKPEQTTLLPTLTPDQQHIVDILGQHTQLSLDEIAALAGMPVPKTASILFGLEMQKTIRALPGRLYEKA